MSQTKWNATVQLYEINQAKLIYHVKSQDHRNFCHEVGDREEREGALEVMKCSFYLAQTPWVLFEYPSSCFFFFFLMIHVLFSIRVTPHLKSLHKNPFACYKRSNHIKMWTAQGESLHHAFL